MIFGLMTQFYHGM